MAARSDVLSLPKPASYMFRAIDGGGSGGIRFAEHGAIKCDAVLSGQLWLMVEGVQGDVGWIYALRFRERVGEAPIDYLTRWRMLLAAADRRSGTARPACGAPLRCPVPAGCHAWRCPPCAAPPLPSL